MGNTETEFNKYKPSLTDEQERLIHINPSDIKKSLEKMGWGINPYTGALIHPAVYYQQ